MPKQKRTAAKAPEIRYSITRKATVQMFFVTAFIAAVLSLCSFVLARAQLQNQVYSQLSGVLYSREYVLRQHVQADKERLAMLAREPSIQALFRSRLTDSAVRKELEALQAQGLPALGLALYSKTNERLASAGAQVQSPGTVKRATVHAHQTEDGWLTYSVLTPVKDSNNEQIGSIGVVFNPAELLQAVLSPSGIGQSSEVVVAARSGERIVLVAGHEKTGIRRPVDVGTYREGLSNNLPVAGALALHSGVTTGYDYNGRHVFSAYTGLDEMQWGLAVTLGHDEAMQGVMRLSLIMVAISILLIGLSAVIARVFARKLTRPITSLSSTMSTLGPGHWNMKSTLSTGDEVEVLETVAVDMANRLHRIYKSMADEIEEQTKELKEQYIKDRAILQTIDYGVVMIDAKGIVTDANTAALDFLRCTKKICTGKAAQDVLDIQVRHAKKKPQHPVTETLKTKKPVRSSLDVRFSILRTDDILIPVMLSCVPLMDGKKVLGAVLVFQDATEQRRVDYLKSEFISLASHQLRTPLSALQWYLELFRDEKNVTSTQKDYLDEMAFASQRMTSLIDALLHAARLESGNIKPQASQVNITELLTELADELRTMGKEKGISCDVDMPKQKLLIETDSVLLHVVFKNLFSNAIKYTKKGGSVGVSMKKKVTGVEVTVTDTGVGIPKVEQGRLFERLFRASNVRKLDTDGNGLGLYITKMIVDSIGGNVAVKSQENKGTQIVVDIPKTMKKQKPKKNGV